jgi:hypothetical protein
MAKRNARPDTADYRDHLYQAPLINVPRDRPLRTWQRYDLPVLDQGEEGACTGFGLATVVNYLTRTQAGSAGGDLDFQASPRMLYEMAKLYDEWPGQDYEGSSVRAAVKGWHKHGVCREKDWPYDQNDPGSLTPERQSRARTNPLGAYVRVNSKSLVDMHAAITETGVLYVSAVTHAGWDDPGSVIQWSKTYTLDGGHAFVLVGYDREGFWVQNSWGAGWGLGGYSKLTYGDWLANGKDVWACRLGVPVVV